MNALLDHLWQSTLFAAAVWLLTLILASNRAAVRHALWFAASIKFLVPFSLLVLFGNWIGMQPVYEPSSAESPVDAALQAASPILAPAARFIATQSTGLAPDTAPAFSLSIALLIAWAAGVLFLAARWFAAWRAASALVRDAIPVGVEQHLDVRASHRAGEPAVARILRPVIVVPTGLVDTLPRDELRAVLAHEREHIVRRDNFKTGLHLLVETLFWFHPLVWWIGRRMIDERERACDEAVVDAGHEGRDYAAGILAVCRHCCADRRVPGAISALSGDLPRRIRRIICGSRPAALGLVKAMALSLLVIATVVVPVTAGAVRDERTRHAIYRHDARVLRTAEVSIVPATRRDTTARMVAHARDLRIENVSLPELIALAYDVTPASINGADGLGSQRYDVHARTATPFADPERFDPAALRGLVNSVLGARFRFEIYVNKRCQAPCGPQALTLEPR